LETIWLNISAGSGPEECAHAAALTLRQMEKEAGESKDLSLRIVETEASREKGNFRSALIALEGENAKPFADSWTGVVQWIWQSAYRPGHKRKNWFVAVNQFAEPPAGQAFSLTELRFETARAGGPGGQHVNKTETAVRVVHIPSGKSATARNERSQALNKKLATARLAAIFEREQSGKKAQAKAEIRQSHWELQRGNPIRVYDGQTLSPVKGKTGKKTEVQNVGN